MQMKTVVSRRAVKKRGNEQTNFFYELEPDNLYKEMEKRKAQLEILLQVTKKRIEEAPNGTLRITNRGNYQQYYHRIDPKDTKGVYICKTQEMLVHSLAQKDYDKKLIKEVEKQIEMLDLCLNKYKSMAIEEIYENLHELRKPLIRPVILPIEQYIQKWNTITYAKKEIVNDYGKFITDAGERVRSKSEIIIANKLHKIGIPYRYEFPISFTSGFTVHPDFYCLNVRTRKEYAWEHFGMMDNEEYANNAIRKIEEYAQNGYWLGKNFIATFESSNKPININIIEKTIQQYLL